MVKRAASRNGHRKTDAHGLKCGFAFENNKCAQGYRIEYNNAVCPIFVGCIDRGKRKIGNQGNDLNNVF